MNTPGSLILQQDPKILLRHLDQINLIPCEIDPESNTFCDTKILTYEIELLNYRNKIGFNLLNDEYFTIPYVIDKIPN